MFSITMMFFKQKWDNVFQLIFWIASVSAHVKATCSLYWLYIHTHIRQFISLVLINGHLGCFSNTNCRGQTLFPICLLRKMAVTQLIISCAFVERIKTFCSEILWVQSLSFAFVTACIVWDSPGYCARENCWLPAGSPVPGRRTTWHSIQLDFRPGD